MNLKESISQWWQQNREWNVSFYSSFIATVLGIVLTFGVTYMIEQQQKREQKRQLLISLIWNIEDTIEQLQADSIEAEKQDSVLTPIFQCITNGTIPDYETFNRATSSLVSWSWDSRDESVLLYFKGNLSVLSLMDVQTVNIINEMDFLTSPFLKMREELDDLRKALAQQLYREALSPNIEGEPRYVAAYHHLLAMPELGNYYMTREFYTKSIPACNRFLQNYRSAIMIANHITEKDLEEAIQNDFYATYLQQHNQSVISANIKLSKR